MFKNDWYRYRYDDNDYYQPKTNIKQKFKTEIFTHHTKILSYKDALIYNAKQILEDFNNPKFALMLSGGSDSEVMLRACLDIKANFNTYIFRYENHANLYDLSYAIVLCESMNVKYNIIDFNVNSFYENEAIDFANIAQTDRPRALPQLKFMDYVDEEICLYGQGDINWSRLNASDYSTLGRWVHNCNEHEIAWEKYIRSKNRKSVMLWFKYTPELQLSTALNTWSQKLINDKFYGKAGVNSTKILGYKEAYPNMISRVKKTGLESFLPIIEQVENELCRINGGLINRQTYTRTSEQYINELKNTIL